MKRVKNGRHIYVVDAFIATFPYVTLHCSFLSCHARYFLKVPVKNNGMCPGS